ncbi:hypothetical protein SteCoe_8522 [Stentor coeruleus]|uniref:Uncharacterized protein n=1 Tax=Stentor coeruleus TaxID=5963 RepID=A0A1R2CJW1_9CILI|nr:hypothetical protein SteCoe_8522 [Stentor coeruleus]
MENFPQLSQSPISSRYGYTQVPRSATTTKRRFITIQTNDNLAEFSSSWTSSSPKRTTSNAIYKEISRLEEELDSYEINQKNSKNKEFFNEKQKEKDLKTYEKFLEGIIYCIGQVDTRISKCLGRGWTSYQKLLNKKIRQSNDQGLNTSRLNKDKKDIAVQVGDIFELIDKDEDFEKYIDILNSVITRIDQMNHSKVVKTLRQLLQSLKPIDIPSLSKIPSLPQQILTENPKELVQKYPEYSENDEVFLSRNKLGNLQVTRYTQTGLTFNDIQSWDYLKVMIKEKDREIRSLAERLEKLDKIEDEFNIQHKELNNHKKTLQELGKTTCRECKEKVKRIEAKSEEIKELKQAVIKTEVVEVELEKTKTKLKESFIVIGKKNEKIREMNENLDGLMKKIQDIASEREILEQKLNDEENKRLMIEEKLQQKLYSNIQLKSTLKEAKKNTKVFTLTPKFYQSNEEKIKKMPINLTTNDNKPIIEQEQGGFSDISIKDGSIRYKSPDVFLSSKKSANEMTSKILTPESNESFSINTSENFNAKLAEIHEDLSANNIVKRSLKEVKQTKEEMILKKLNMTQAEYLGLSKKARMEIFEILLAHNNKCGSECEHLKRVMMIKYRDKGTLYPTKKYNI